MCYTLHTEQGLTVFFRLQENISGAAHKVYTDQ